jgi:hypothetical protein
VALSLGQHNLIISVAADTFYSPSGSAHDPHFYDVSSTVAYAFKNTPPTITCLSPQNTTFNTTYLPLIFSVNQTTTWYGFSLDNQANVTV